MKKLIALWLLVASTSFSFAQEQNRQLSSSEILHKMHRLRKMGSVLYLAAHPDDENTRLISWLVNQEHLRTGYLSLTRGDGGQNLIGNEQAEELGLIRTQELLAARRTDGGEQYFTRAFDFGYSKNPLETFTIWQKDSILHDVVWVIRQFQPDVIICRFPTTGEGGHGHHTASAMLAEEAFEAAADPKRFPEQLKYVSVWKTQRLFWNTFNFGGRNTTSEDQFKIDVGGFHPLLGKSYGEIASTSRSQHRSQGFGSALNRGTQFEYLKTLKGKAPEKELMEGIETGWKRIPNGAIIEKKINDLIKNFSPSDPSKSLPGLLAMYENVKGLENSTWKNVKLKELEDLIISCSGLWLEAIAEKEFAVPGQEFSVTLQAVNRNKVAVTIQNVSFRDQTMISNWNPGLNEKSEHKKNITIPSNEEVSQPYWLNEDRFSGRFDVKGFHYLGKAENPPSLSVVFSLLINGKTISVERPVRYKFTDPSFGEIYRLVPVCPPVTVNMEAEQAFLLNGAPTEIKVRVKSFVNNASGKIRLELPEGFSASTESSEFFLERPGDEQFIQFTIEGSGGGMNKIYTVKAIAEMGGSNYDRAFRSIIYDHIPAQRYFPKATAKLIPVQLAGIPVRLGYISGAGDKIPEVMRSLGTEVILLDEKMILESDLSDLDAIVIGVRAFNTDERLPFIFPKLLNYVQEGGSLLVQYNTNRGLVSNELGPYPIQLGRGRVTNENAEMRPLGDSIPLLMYPNQLTDDDMKNWVQERGLYFVDSCDNRYQKVFSSNDDGEEPLEGSLIYTTYGKGKFVYTGISFFRQLPAGVPGAIRLFVNLLHSEKPAVETPMPDLPEKKNRRKKK